MQTNIELMKFLNENEEARNDYKKGWITFVTRNIENPIEKAILEKYLPVLMPESNYRREVAVIQNTLWIFEPNEETKQKRAKHRRKLQKWYSPITNLFRW